MSPFPASRRPLVARILTPIIAILLLLALIGGYVGGKQILTAYKALAPAMDQLASLRAQTAKTQPPTEFGANCVKLWLQSGQGATGRLDGACSASETPEGQRPNVLAVDATGLNPPLTRQINGIENYWSVAVLVHVNEKQATPDKKEPFKWVDGGTSTWRVAVWVDPVTGTPVMQERPRRVATATPADLPRSKTSWSMPDPSDPRTALVTAYLTSYLISGEVTNYLVPGATSLTVHDPTYAAVRLDATSYTNDPDENHVQAGVRVTVLTKAGNTINAQYNLRLVRVTEDLWQIQGTTDAAPLAAH